MLIPQLNRFIKKSVIMPKVALWKKVNTKRKGKGQQKSKGKEKRKQQEKAKKLPGDHKEASKAEPIPDPSNLVNINFFITQRFPN